MSWTWNLGHIIGVNVADPKRNPFAMDRTPERIYLPWKSKLKKKRKWRGVGANTAKNPHFATGLILASNPKDLKVKNFILESGESMSFLSSIN